MSTIESEIKTLKEIVNFLQKTYGNIDNIKLPIHIKNIVYNGIIRFNDKKYKRIKDRSEICKLVYKFCKNIPNALYGKNINIYDNEIYKSRISILVKMIYFNLASKPLMKNKITYEGLSWIFEEIENKLKKYMLTPGEAIGIICATLIGSSATQLTLNSFHFLSSAVYSNQDFKVIKALLSAAKRYKNNPQDLFTRIFIQKKYINKTNLILNDLIPTKIKDLYDNTMCSMVINDDKFFTEKKSVITEDNKYIKYIYDKLQLKKYINLKMFLCIRLKFCKKKLYDRYISIHEDIIPKLYETLDIYENEIVIIPISDNIVRVFIHDIYPRAIEKIRENIIPNINLRGIKNIFDAQIFNGKNKIFINAKGVNLESIMKLSYIDKLKTFCNSIWNTFEFMGIEACRNLFAESYYILFYSNSIRSIDLSYFHLLAAKQTCLGYPIQLTAHGLSDFIDNGPWQKIAHERVEKFITEMALYTEKENMDSPSSGTAYSQYGFYGTGACDIHYS